MYYNLLPEANRNRIRYVYPLVDKLLSLEVNTGICVCSVAITMSFEAKQMHSTTYSGLFEILVSIERKMVIYFRIVGREILSLFALYFAQ